MRTHLAGWELPAMRMATMMLSLLMGLASLVSSRDVASSRHQHHAADMQVQTEAVLSEMGEINIPQRKTFPPNQSTFDEVFSRISFTVHHNGDPIGCGVIPPSLDGLQRAISSMEATTLDKYQVESLLTSFVADQLETSSCQPTDQPSSLPGILGFCDMGPAKTVIQKDHEHLVRVPGGSLPCRFFTREGLRISSIELLQSMAEERIQECSLNHQCGDSVSLDLYAVPAGRMFMFGPSQVGEVFELKHVKDTLGNNLVVKTLALEPRVFDIYNFFSLHERDELVLKALRETSESHGFHRSTTGTTGKSIFNKRTSENAWDTHGATAQVIKRRCFTALGIDEYHEELSDGLQILRYNVSNAYTVHLDYLNDRGGEEAYDYDTSGKGGNRFATILLYFNDMEEGAGGETLFPHAWPPELPDSERIEKKEALRLLRESGDASMLAKGSWEEEMTALCRTRLAVKPNATRAVLFYSQFPNGAVDPKSEHGACPVLKGTKLAANLWTWSAVRPEYPGAPRKRELRPDEVEGSQFKKIYATFTNSGKDPRFNSDTKVYYDEDGFFGNLGTFRSKAWSYLIFYVFFLIDLGTIGLPGFVSGPKDRPVSVNTYQGHKWNIKVGGKTLKTFVIGSESTYNFVV